MRTLSFYFGDDCEIQGDRIERQQVQEDRIKRSGQEEMQ